MSQVQEDSAPSPVDLVATHPLNRMDLAAVEGVGALGDPAAGVDLGEVAAGALAENPAVGLENLMTIIMTMPVPDSEGVVEEEEEEVDLGEGAVAEEEGEGVEDSEEEVEGETENLLGLVEVRCLSYHIMI